MNSAQVSLKLVNPKACNPIPGAKNADQVMQNNQAVGWSLTEDQVTQLDDLSAVILKLRSG
jgi:diketogulonate reductase-like aldo/keto reductase